MLIVGDSDTNVQWAECLVSFPGIINWYMVISSNTDHLEISEHHAMEHNSDADWTVEK